MNTKQFKLALQRDIEAIAKKELERQAKLVTEYAKLYAPVQLGDLRDSIDYTIVGYTAFIRTDVPYAGYVEYGSGIYSLKGGRTNPWTYFNPVLQQFFTTYGQQPSLYMSKAIQQLRSEL